MSEQLEVSVNLTDRKVQFTGTARSNPPIVCDYFPPLGEGEGYTGLELLLVSLAVCSGTTVVLLLRQMQKTVSGFSVKAKGIRRHESPTSFKTISLEFHLNSGDAADADIQKAIKMSEEKYCPVWDMVRNNVEIVTGYRIITEST